jgi:hypothetical protein
MLVLTEKQFNLARSYMWLYKEVFRDPDNKLLDYNSLAEKTAKVLETYNDNGSVPSSLIKLAKDH